MAAFGLLAACSAGEAERSGGRDGQPVQVGFVVIQASSVPIENSLPGRVAAFQISDVRPQVSGVILRRLFAEGSVVRQGQTLYQIDPSIYQAQVAQAAANVQSARASAEAASARAARYKPLAEMEAVSKQDYTDALAQARQANAAIAQNNASLRAAQINLRYTRVPAPISGRIGLSNFTEGALVTANQAESLTTITRLDPVYVDIQQSAPDLLVLRRSLTRGGTVPAMAQVRLTLPDGSDYGYTGTIQFTEVVVNADTGSVTLRARFPNPQSILLPGMFVTARLAQSINTTAYLVPQQAIARDPKGNATLWVVGPGNTAVQRTVVAERTDGQNWVVTQGLAVGEKVITQGVGNLREGAKIKAVPASTPQRTAPARPAGRAS
ncbi:MAG TPA: efflux RND transporter periplasmic adaptor subunit [Sphingomicrobium sp.]|jgi:membrane fusion protein (multidrug efflux system)|nr:efflux RND transporter periplasmic adaptor subunit [Sphingomicrobium sp.]